ncbi:MAG: chromosome segregation protein SMC [Dehalococcoidia bacterium]
MLRGLEMVGFKTFASRTRFEFRGDLTAIVGPNGSGKSNLADAVRWVLAEPAGRGLRVRKSEDLIFTGGGGRTASGFAEATVLLDNTARSLPFDLDEVSVTRRLHRSGESEYWLNGTRVRLREVIEALSRAGIAQSSYAVIGQGLIDQALSLRPEERRELIEEAADIRSHQAALEDARTRLTATRANLVRLDDLIGELRPRVAKLAKQASDADEHRRLAGDLASLLAGAYAIRWLAANHRYQHVAASADHANQEVDRARTALQAAAERLAALRSETLAMRQQHDSTLNDLRNAESAADRARHEAAYAVREIERLEVEVAQVEEEVAEGVGRVDEGVAALAEASNVLDAVRRETAALAQDAPPSKGEAERALQAARQRLGEAQSASVSAEIERRGLVALSERLITELETLDATDDPDDSASAQTGEVERLAALGADLGARIDRLQTERQVLRADLAGQDERLAAARVERAAIGERLREAERRLASLAREEAAGDGLFPAVRAILERAGRSFAAVGGRPSERGIRLDGIVGTVAELIAVPAGYELAFEVALGAHGQDIIVEVWGDAEAAIDYLRQSGAGRATFLPLDSIQPGRRSRWPSEPGVYGVAADLCTFDPRFTVAIDRLLGNIVVVDDLAVARRCLRQNGRGQVFVTLQGDTVGSWGAVSGGSRPTRRDGILRRRAAVASLAKERADLLDRESALSSAVEKLSAELQSGRRDESQLAEEQASLERSAVELNGQLARAQAQAERARLAEVEALRRRERTEARRTGLLAERERHHAAIAALDSRIALATVAVRAVETDLLSLEQQATLERERQAEAGARLAASRAAERSAEDAVRRAQSALEREREIAERARRRLNLLNDQIGQARQDAARHQNVTSAAVARATSLRDLALRTGATRRVREADLEGIAAEEQQKRDILTGAAERLADGRREREAAAEALDVLRARIEADGLDPDHLPPPAEGAETDDLDRRVTRLRARLRTMPAGGYQVIAEYEEERERLDILASQAEDLRAAEANLSRTIGSLERLVAERFDQTVAAVNREFRRYFQRLFGGGSARLGIGEDAGIEIEAHPPGKRPQNLSLLSGGERALTAAALVFALLQVNPIPFCVLDEVDAALDESNVRRFVEALQELAVATQFVVITHNRVTIEAASTVYGLAVAADGSTKVVSLQLREASPPATSATG